MKRDWVIYVMSPAVISADELKEREIGLEKIKSDELLIEQRELDKKCDQLVQAGFLNQAESVKNEIDIIKSEVESLKSELPAMAQNELRAEYLESIGDQKINEADYTLWEEWLEERHVKENPIGFEYFHYSVPPEEIMDLIVEISASGIFDNLRILTKSKTGKYAILVGHFDGNAYLLAQWNHVDEPVKDIKQIRAGLRAKKWLNWMDIVSWFSFVFGIVAVPVVMDWPKNMSISHPPTLTGNWWLVPAIFFSLPAVYYPVKRVIREKFNFIF